MSPISRRSLALGLAGLPLPALAAKPVIAPLSAADQAMVDRAGTYLQGLTEAKGSFVQTDARGAVTQGTLFIKRPGKARFAYEAPSGLLVVSDGTYVSIADSRLKTFDRYLLSVTPLSLFLARQIRFDRSVVVSRVSRMADGFSITARDGRKEAEGQITLTFSDSPMNLIGWTVSDAQGQSTRVRLTNFAPAPGLAPSLFVLKDPRPARPNNGRV